VKGKKGDKKRSHSEEPKGPSEGKLEFDEVLEDEPESEFDD
jgi:hypothetical protein